VEEKSKISIRVTSLCPLDLPDALTGIKIKVNLFVKLLENLAQRPALNMSTAIF
jgi:hypothetical protein